MDLHLRSSACQPFPSADPWWESATLVAVEEMTLRGPSPSVLFRLADDSGVGEFADGLA